MNGALLPNRQSEPHLFAISDNPLNPLQGNPLLVDMFPFWKEYFTFFLGPKEISILQVSAYNNLEHIVSVSVNYFHPNFVIFSCIYILGSFNT